MSVTAILPVKRFDRAKQRLNGQLGVGSRAALSSAMLADVLTVLDHMQSLQAILLVSGEPMLQELALGGRTTLIPDLTEKGQSPAALAGLARAREEGYDCAVLVPGDCPLIDPLEMDDLVSAAKQHDVVIVPDRHGRGTNAIAFDPELEFEPRFGPDSLGLHVQQAIDRELRYTVEPVPSLALDIDTGEDLTELAAVLERLPDRASHTQAALREIERTQPVSVHA